MYDLDTIKAMNRKGARNKYALGKLDRKPSENYTLRLTRAEVVAVRDALDSVLFCVSPEAEKLDNIRLKVLDKAQALIVKPGRA
jgi:hypothetical protein